MSTFRLPLSGSVNQTVNPWTWFFSSVGSQFGLININLGKSSDPELEGRILEEVGSYGSQIGQLGDAIKVLLDHVKLDHLKPEEQQAVDAVRAQLTQIERQKRKRLEEKRPE
jgi:hypothetical protein